jgi:hypothetical protein
MGNEIEIWMENYPPQIQSLVQQMREWVKTVLPDAAEVLATGYKMIMYKVEPKAKEWVVYIGPYPNHANLGFIAGTSLPDPHKLLKGTGKTLRHIKIKQATDLERNGVKELVEAAWQEDIQHH